MTESVRPVTVFISYAHGDDGFRRALDAHLALLKREGVIAVWHDRLIAPGHDWASEIDTNLAKADLAVFLVSPDFMASDYCYGIEMNTVLEAEDARWKQPDWVWRATSTINRQSNSSTRATV